MLHFRQVWHVALYVVIAFISMPASAQGWPSKPVKIVVPFSAGGSTDAIARYLAKKMETATKQSVVVENITGGGTIIGVQSVARAPADGAAMVLMGSGTVTVMKHTTASLPIDPEAALMPVTLINTLPHWIVVRADRPEKTFQEFVDLIRKNPGKVNISVNAIGGAAHLALASWARTNGLEITVVPYRGSSAAMVDLLGGATTAHVDVVGSSLQFVKAGKARALAVLQQKTIGDLPDVPATAAESNGGLRVDSQHLLAVRGGTPAPIVNRIYEVVTQVTAEPDFIDYLKSLGFERTAPTPAKSKEILTQESKRYRDIVRATNIKVN